MQYKNFILDEFQEQAIQSIDKNHSVIVSAATGTGKTLIADYTIDKSIKEGKRVIYTAPIKALSNQKFRDFKAEYGDKIGLLTGDIVINKDAQILVMTTEIYRNMLVSNTLIKDLTYVIFDEIHFMNDIERGTVWEESIIFSPTNIRILGLSATIPNADEFASWISSIKNHRVDVIKYSKRAVPLEHFFFWNEAGVINLDDFQELKQAFKRERVHYKRGGRGKSRLPQLPKPNHLDLVQYVYENDLLNCIFFTFSRSQTRQNALEAIQKFDFTTKEEKAEIVKLYHEIIPINVRSMGSIQELRQMIVYGIALHNAGILPKAKELVEILFSKGLVKLLYATETFAVGINMPARTVCFNALRKFDGITFRYVSPLEYQQLAGRAGRRGIDTVGHVFALVDVVHDNKGVLNEITTGVPEPIVSQFQLGVNVVLNLKDKYDDEQIETILKSNFGYFMKKKETAQQIRIMSSFKNIVKKLRKLGYLKGDDLTRKGFFASRIYSDELLISELLFNNTFNNLSPVELVLLIAAIVYEPRERDRFKFNKKARLKIEVNPLIKKKLKFNHIKKLDYLVRSWCGESDFDKLLDLTSLEEGDIIRLFRQVIDRLRQIKQANIYIEGDSNFTDKCDYCLSLVDKEVISVEF